MNEFQHKSPIISVLLTKIKKKENSFRRSNKLSIPVGESQSLICPMA